MLHISHEIQQLEAAELDFNDEDNSGYLRLDALKRQELKLWREYCRLKGSNPQVARFDRQLFRYNGSRFPEINRAVENLVRSSHNMPDYPDVRKLVENVYSTLSCSTVSRAIDKEAQKIFVDVCQKLKNLRELEFQRDIYHPPGVDRTNADDDPALHSPGLRKRLKANERLAVSTFKSVITKYSRLQDELEENQEVDLGERASEDYQPSSITRPTFDECEAEEPLPISTEDAQISCPIFEERESSGEVPPPPNTSSSSNSSPETIVITDGEEDTISSNINDDDDDEPEIVGVEYRKPPTRNQLSQSAAAFSSQNPLQHTTINHRRFALPLGNGSTMLFSMAEQRVVQVIPRSL
ncbi:unnamed protein product [Hymenolepis diminuta]|nr:unnamed protein product [Hymenolepis diminuta]